MNSILVNNSLAMGNHNSTMAINEQNSLLDVENHNNLSMQGQLPSYHSQNLPHNKKSASLRK